MQIVEECDTIDILQLKLLLRQGEKKSDTYHCKNTKLQLAYCPETGLQIDFDFEGQSQCQQIAIEAIPTNLGKGHRHYFVCPETGKRATKLYRPRNEKTFLHRKAWPRLFYQDQVRSRQEADLRFVKAFKEYKRLCELATKRHYQGKPTKLQQRIKTKRQKAEKLKIECYTKLLERTQGILDNIGMDTKIYP